MNISCPINPLGLRSLNGQYTRKSITGFRTLSFAWYIDVNDAGECLLYTDDALTDCYTSGNAIRFDSIGEALIELRRVIENVAA